jgi:hypothetical protein
MAGRAERAAQQQFEARVPRPLGRPPDFEARIAAALTALVAAEAEFAQVQARQSEARERIRESKWVSFLIPFFNQYLRQKLAPKIRWATARGDRLSSY